MANNTKASKYSVALSLVKKIGHKTYKKIIEEFGTAEAFFKSSSLSKKADQQITTQQESLLTEASEAIEAHEQQGIIVTAYEDPSYPKRLRQIHAPPPILYSTTELDLNKQRILAIVGTREATNYGKDFVKKLVAHLQSHNVIIISGLAHGIDATAHKAALKHAMPTIGVIAGGLDMIYPADHRPLASAMTKQGAILSEQPLKTMPDRHYFPQRNRIIAGISDAVVVVEAGKKSGALITARYANESNRDVFALPGSIDSPYMQGCHQLIKTHQAHMITDPTDLTYIMNWHAEKGHEKLASLRIPLESLDTEERRIIKQLYQKSPLDLHTLSVETALPIDKVLGLLLQLEVKNLIRALPGNQYELRL